MDLEKIEIQKKVTLAGFLIELTNKLISFIEDSFEKNIFK